MKQAAATGECATMCSSINTALLEMRGSRCM